MKLLLLLAACSGADAYIVEGTVLEKPDADTIVVAHEEIAGFMPAMTMSFDVRDVGEIAEVQPGDRITARLLVEEGDSWLAKVRVTGDPARVPLTAESSVAEWFADPRGAELLGEAFAAAMAEGGENTQMGALVADPNVLMMLGSLPLIRMARFPGSPLRPEVVEKLVAAAN